MNRFYATKRYKDSIENYLSVSGGYHPDVFVDETHAYILTNLKKMSYKMRAKVVVLVSVNGHV